MAGLSGRGHLGAHHVPVLCANINAYGLHAALRCGADEPQPLEQLCHYITRPAPTGRIRCTAAGQVVLKLKTPCRDGTSNLEMSPLVFMQQSTSLASGRAARASDCFKAINLGQRVSLKGRPAPVRCAISPPES